MRTSPVQDRIRCLKWKKATICLGLVVPTSISGDTTAAQGLLVEKTQGSSGLVELAAAGESWMPVLMHKTGRSRVSSQQKQLAQHLQSTSLSDHWENIL